MKVTCLREELYKTLGVLRGVQVGPMVSHTLITADENGLTLAVAGLELYARRQIEAKVEESEGEVAVPTKYLYEIVKSAPGDVITLEAEAEDLLNIRSTGYRATLRGFPDVYPNPRMPVTEDAESVGVNAEAFRAMLNRVIFAVSDRHLVLGNVFVQFEGNTVALAASDGVRLAYCSANGDPSPSARAILVPLSAMKLLKSVLALDGAESLAIVYATRQTSTSGVQGMSETEYVRFVTGQTTVVANLYSAEYPDFRKVIPDPQKRTVRAEVSTKTLLRACRRVRAIRGTGVFVHPVEDGVELKARGESEDLLNAPPSFTSKVEGTVEGKAPPILVNVRYLIEALSAIGSPDVVVELFPPRQPMVIRPADDDGLNYVYVVMPMVAS